MCACLLARAGHVDHIARRESWNWLWNWLPTMAMLRCVCAYGRRVYRLKTSRRACTDASAVGAACLACSLLLILQLTIRANPTVVSFALMALSRTCGWQQTSEAGHLLAAQAQRCLSPRGQVPVLQRLGTHHTTRPRQAHMQVPSNFLALWYCQICVAMSDCSQAKSSPALSSLCVSQLVKELGRSATDSDVQVHCGGTVSLRKPATLFTGAQHFDIPLSVEDLRQLKLQFEPASFGRGQRETWDTEYRQALKLASDKVAFSFDLCNWPILAQVKQVLMPSTDKEILAEEDKVNLYTEGGFFKEHKDTPRSKTMFGSLVLCLPCPFAGGQLVIKHRSGQQVYDWGANSSNSNRIQWAAFYSDCTHEVMPVTEGTRLTVTYNLYVDSMTAREHLTSATTKFSESLARALKEPGFMSEGGI